MTEVHFRLPSKLPYAYVEVRGTPEEIQAMNYESLAALFANAMYAYGKQERASIDQIAGGGTGIVPPKPAVPAEDAAQEVMDQLGATEIDNVNQAPYKAPAPPAKAKPWQADKPAPKVEVDIEGW